MITNFLSKEIVSTQLDQYHLDEYELFSSSYKNYEVKLYINLGT